MTNHATGKFEVTMKPLPPREEISGTPVGRMSLDKVFVGGLVGVGQGEMLAAMTETKGSAGYVAIERVTGTLDGRTGSFIFQHSGTMNRGAPTLAIGVVPDSGTGDLAGITGTFTINIVDGKHFYEFEYSLP
jgi:hypothetical protein